MAVSHKQHPGKTAPSVLSAAASTSTTATASETSTSSSAPTSATTPVVTTPSLEPPDITVPAPPAGYVPVNLDNYRGFHPMAAQITALPDAVTELEAATSYDATFGAAVPPAPQLAGDLSIAARWTALRIALQTLLAYARSNEAVAWKTGLTELDQLNAVFQVVAKQSPQLIAAFPATARLLDVPKVLAKRRQSARVRNAKAKAEAAKAAATTQSTGAPAVAPAANATGASSAVPANGGATH